jgi:hypothetical protein
MIVFRNWLQQTRLSTAPNTVTAKAIDYSLKRWATLKLYTETGDLPIDNNPVENSIRPIALGKKELVVRRFRMRRTTGGRHSNFTRHRQSQWPWSCRLVKRQSDDRVRPDT